MRIFFFAILFAALAVPLLPAQQVAAPPEPEKPSLRARLYEFAGLPINEGFKVRDTAWSGELQGKQPRRLAVNLFAGNQYWFLAASSASGETPQLSLRDPGGREVETVSSERGGMAAAGVTAPVTGRYILQIEGAAKGTREFCVLYLFK